MSDSYSKYEFFFDEDTGEPTEKLNVNYTPLKACNVLNELAVKYGFSDEDFEELESVKGWIKNRMV